MRRGRHVTKGTVQIDFHSHQNSPLLKERWKLELVELLLLLQRRRLRPLPGDQGSLKVLGKSV